ncbi:MAG: II family cellulose-binding protein, partial [Candidatus Nephrothrix sp. EaCA]
MLAYTNRFLALSSLVRNLHAMFKEGKEEGTIRGQIK